MTTRGPLRSWITVDFKPAPPGWRLAYLEEEKEHLAPQLYIRPFPGWLVQESQWYTVHNDEPMIRKVPPPEHALLERRVVAGDIDPHDSGLATVVPALDFGPATFWKLLAPGEERPSESAMLNRSRDMAQQREMQERMAEARDATEST